MIASTRVISVWSAFVIALVAVVYLEWRDVRSATQARTGQEPVFSFREPDLAQVDIVFQGKIATLLRSPNGQWLQHDTSHRHEPASAGGASASAAGASPAGGGAVAAAGTDHPHQEPDAKTAAELGKALDVLTRTFIDRKVTPTEAPKEYGLENPSVMIAFYAKGQDGKPSPAPLTVLSVGKVLTTTFHYYTSLSNSQQMNIVPLYQINRLILLTFGVDLEPVRSSEPAPGTKPASGMQ